MLTSYPICSFKVTAPECTISRGLSIEELPVRTFSKKERKKEDLPLSGLHLILSLSKNVAGRARALTHL